MNKKYIFFIIVLIIFCIGASFRPIGCKNTISGTITDQNNDPIEGATVGMDGFTPVVTGADGIYTFEDVPYDTYTITVSHDSYGTTSKDISIDYLNNGIACKDVDTNFCLGFTFGSPWEEIGEGSASDGGISNTCNNFSDSGEPFLVINTLGNPVVAWSDGFSGDEEIYIKQWNGTSWEEIGAASASGGGISNNSGYSYYPSLAINASGNPVVAWRDGSSGNSEIYIKQWNGSSWEEIGTGSSSGGGISNGSGFSIEPVLAINNSGNPVVAWSTGQIYFKQWTGSNWEELGGSASTGGISNLPFPSNDSRYPSIAINGSGNPVIAWCDFISETAEVYLRQWNGTTWEELDGSGSGGGVSNNSGYSILPSIAINGSGNPVVAWQDNTSGDYEIYIKQWNGSSWEEIGTGSSSGGGISNNFGNSGSPSVAINNSGNPVVAWSDESSGNYEIYVLQWNGSSREEIGTGSSLAGGISHNAGDSGEPSLAIDTSGNPVVAWSDRSYYCEIYIKRWEPDN